LLPPRPNDVVTLPGAELEGFMPRRGDFDVEWENDAEHAVADMEFLPGESAQDKQLKLQVLAIYSSKLDARETRKKFVLSRGLLNYRKNHTEDQSLPRDERDPAPSL
jgi:transcriptional adapter 2-alpha